MSTLGVFWRVYTFYILLLLSYAVSKIPSMHYRTRERKYVETGADIMEILQFGHTAERPYVQRISIYYCYLYNMKAKECFILLQPYFRNCRLQLQPEIHERGK